jgi:hypothetical protein
MGKRLAWKREDFAGAPIPMGLLTPRSPSQHLRKRRKLSD